MVPRIDEEWSRAAFLAKLTPRLVELGHLEEALGIARAIADKWWRAELLAGLAPYVIDTEHVSVLSEALDTACAVQEGSQGYALALLAPYLPIHLLPQALMSLWAIKPTTSSSADNYRTGLAALAARLERLPPSSLYPIWRDTLRTEVAHTRADLLAYLGGLPAVIAVLGGPEAVLETAQAVLKVAHRWP